MSIARISVSSILEKMISRYSIDEIYIHMDPISLKFSSEITIKRVRRIYVENVGSFLFKMLESDRKFIFLVGVGKGSICSIFHVLRKIVHISQRNENMRQGLIVLFALDESVFSDIIDIVLKNDIPLYVPMDMNSIMALGIKSFVDGSDRINIMVIEPEIANMEVIGEEVDLKSMEKNLANSSLVQNVKVGRGRLAVIGFGYALSTAMDVIKESEIIDDISLYGFIKIDSTMRKNIENILSKHRNVVFLVFKNIINDRIRSIAEKLIEDGKINWVPNITFVEDFFDNPGRISKQAIRYVLLNILGLGSLDEAPNISTFSKIRLNLCEKTVKLLNELKDELKSDIIAISPLYDRSVEIILSDMYDLFNYVISEKSYIVLAHLCDFASNVDVLQKLSKLSDKKMVFVAVTDYVGEGLKKQLTKKITGVIQQHMSILSFEEGLEKILKKIKKRNKALVIL